MVGTTQEFTISILEDDELEDQETVSILAGITEGEGIFSTGFSTDIVFIAIGDNDLSFIGDTPDVNGNIVTITFNADPSLVISATCQYTNLNDQDCKYD